MPDQQARTREMPFFRGTFTHFGGQTRLAVVLVLQAFHVILKGVEMNRVCPPVTLESSGRVRKGRGRRRAVTSSFSDQMNGSW